MNPQTKLKNMLELLIMLNCKYGRTKQALAEHFEVSTKTISRYFNTFKEVGFVLEENDKHWKINKEESDYKDLSELLHFSQEESLILREAIESIDTVSNIKEQLAKKLYSIYNFDRVATPLIKTSNQEKVEKLNSAISKNKRCFLIKYKSSNSSKITDRYIEPFDFTHNFRSLWALDIKDKKVKMFTVSRIKKVEVQDEEMEYKSLHIKPKLDIFRMTGSEETEVELILSLRAQNLLTEEYPLSEKYIKKINENEYLLKTKIYSFEGVSRFVMGLFEEIEVVGPEELKIVLKEKVSRAENKIIR